MMRDPLDELIEDLERLIPAKAPKPAFDPADFQWEAERLDRMSLEDVQALNRKAGTGADVPRSTISIAPALWPAKPARRPDPSAPWDYTGDTDPDDSGD